MTTSTDFRTCPTTGLKVHLQTEKLIKANAVVAWRIAILTRRALIR